MVSVRLRTDKLAGMAEFIYTMKKVRKAHGDKVILDDVTMSFYPGAKIGVVGPNGAGKSSILKIMAGIDQPGNGEAFLAPGASVGILMQEPILDDSKNVRENVEDGLGETMVQLKRYNEIAELMATDYSDELMEEMGDLQEKLDHADAWEIDSQLEQAMDALRCPPPESPVTNLSGGEKRRVALCKLLLSKPDLLLLDEPTNHLDAESVLWLEQHLAAYPGAILAVTHDRYFLDHVAQWIAEVDRGHLYPYEGNYSTYLEKKAERLEVSGEGRTLRCDNFRTTAPAEGKAFKTLNQDKGQAAAIAATLEAVRRGGASPIPLEQIDGVSRGTFAIVESIASGQAVTLD